MIVRVSIKFIFKLSNSRIILYANFIIITCRKMVAGRSLSHYATPVVFFVGLIQIITMILWMNSNQLNKTPWKGNTESSQLLNSSSKSRNTVVIYNRIPKTGSTSLMQLPYELCSRNKYNVVLLNLTGGPRSYTMNLRDRMSFAWNITGA